MEENPQLVTEKFDELPPMKVALNAAVGKNNELGRNSELLWNLSEDMQFFKETTGEHYVMMGRKSFDGALLTLQSNGTILMGIWKNYQNNTTAICEKFTILRK